MKTYLQNHLLQINGIVFRTDYRSGTYFNDEFRQYPLGWKMELGKEDYDYFLPIFSSGGEVNKRYKEESKTAFLIRTNVAMVLKQHVLNWEDSLYRDYKEDESIVLQEVQNELLSIVCVFRYFKKMIQAGKKDYPSFGKYDNDKVDNAIVRWLRRNGTNNLVDIYPSSNGVMVVENINGNNIYTGIEEDGYTHQ